MDYLPEWKIYLWKKILLDKGSFNGTLKPANFIFFEKNEKRNAMASSVQASIDSINLAVANGTIGSMHASGHTSFEDCYYHFEPKAVMKTLVELAEADEKIIAFENIVLSKSYLDFYKKKRREYLAMEEKKRIASISIGSESGKKQSESYFNDKFCGLGSAIYTKVEKSEELSLIDLKIFLGTGLPIFDFFTFKIKFDKPALGKKLDEYIDNFTAGNLIPGPGIRYFDPSQQLKNVLAAIEKLAATFGKNLAPTSGELAKAGGWYLRDEPHYRVLETLFALEKSGNLEMKDLRKHEIIISFSPKPKPVGVSTPDTTGAKKSVQQAGPKSTIAVGDLAACEDGSIRYNGKTLDLRPQIKDLCWLFMERHNQLINADDIKEKIIKASKRKNTSLDTISKYVSELHKVLEIHFGKSVITNEPKGGWIFNP